MTRLLLLIAFADAALCAANVPQWSLQELSFQTARQYSNPYEEADMTAEFNGPGGERAIVHGFPEGGTLFKVRWTPTAQGVWRYRTRSADPGLNGKTGEVRATPPRPGEHGFLRRDAAHPYSFVFDDGTRYFLFGNTLYGLVENAVAGDGWKEAVDKTRDYGMNKIRFNIGRHSFGQRHTGQPDNGAMRKLDEIARYLGERGIIADFIIFNRDQVDAIDEDQGRRFLRYIIARYGAFTNVIWCLQNEWQYTKKPKPFWNAMGEFAAKEDPWMFHGQSWRGLSVHQQTRYDWEFYDDKPFWYSHAIIQLGVRNRGKAHRGGDEWNLPRNRQGVFANGDDWGNFGIVHNYGRNVPVVNDEYGYIGEPKDETERGTGGDIRYTRDKHRRTMWAIYAGGGYGSAGDKNDYPQIGQPYRTANWHDAPEWADVKRLIDFFKGNKIEYWKMGPHNELVKSGTRVYALAEPGRQYVIYAAAGGSFSVELAGGPYEAIRFDPRTGKDVPIRKAESGVVSFTMPDAQDWVLYLKRAN